MILNLVNLFLHEHIGITILTLLFHESLLYLNNLIHNKSLSKLILIDNIEV